MSLCITGTVLGFVMACCVMDVRTRRIPNALSASCIVIGALLNISLSGMAGLAHSMAGSVLGMAILLGPFAAGGIGGGDVKMMAAVGAFLGPALTFFALCTGFILGGLLMMLHLTRIGRLQEKLVSTGSMVMTAVRARSLTPLQVMPQMPNAVALPYSVALGLGTFLVVILAGTSGHV